MGVHHALGPAGRARGVDQGRDVVAARRRARLVAVVGLLGQGVEVVVALGDVRLVVGAADEVVDRADLACIFSAFSVR